MGLHGLRPLLAIGVIGAAAMVASCTHDAPSAPTDPLATTLHSYVTNATLRRSALEGSLVNPDNGYARLRLAKYRDDSDWGLLGEFDPPTTPITTKDVDDSAPAFAPASSATWSSGTLDSTALAADDWSLAALKLIGERAFYNYPMQLVSTLPTAIHASDRAGMWDHDGRTGAVWARLSSGDVAASFTCSTCHAVVDHDVLITGRNNADLDVGRMNGDGVNGPSWGLGRVDVTPDDIENPVTITDLRPLRYQTNLHHAATLRNDPMALAVRIETLIITSQNESIRPPRKIVAGLVAFLLNLAPDAPQRTDMPGAAVFARTCAGCHQGDGATGPAVPLDVVGTDPLVGQSPDRGTGTYRVPSLRFVGDRHRLFAGGAIEDIDDLLAPSPERSKKGHLYGLDLGDADRAALIDFLRTL